MLQRAPRVNFICQALPTPTEQCKWTQWSKNLRAMKSAKGMVGETVRVYGTESIESDDEDVLTSNLPFNLQKTRCFFTITGCTLANLNAIRGDGRDRRGLGGGFDNQSILL